MRHRKKLLLAALLLMAGYTALFFWPHSNPEAVQTLATVRPMILLDDANNAPAGILNVAAAKLDGGDEIRSSVAIVKINMTHATAGLFAAPGQSSDYVVVGRIKSLEQFLAVLQSSNAVSVESRPRLTTFPGQSAKITISSGVPVMTPAGAWAPVAADLAGESTTFAIVAHITPSAAILLSVECDLSHVKRVKTVATPQGPKDVPEMCTVSAKASAELKRGETLVIGGTTRKRPERIMVKLPILGDLPGLGPKLCFNREREIQEEVVILVTPEIVGNGVQGQ